MMAEPKQITQPKLLVVEGKEDELFFDALIKHLKLNDIQILAIGGKQELRKHLGAMVKTTGFNNVVSLGVVRDADDDPQAAFQSVQDALRAANLPVPAQPLLGVEGLLPRGQNLKVVGMIVPAINRPGMLEDICLDAAVQDPAMSCVDGFFQCLMTKGIPLPRNMPKAKIQAFLASRPEPGKRLGEAAQAGYFSWQHQAFKDVTDFVRLI